MVELTVLKKIEAEAYPPHMQQLQEFESWDEVADYGEVTPKKLLVYTEAKKMYMLIGVHRKYIEVIDMASIGRFNIFKVLNFIKVAAKGKKIRFDAKEDTSYPLILFLAQHNKLKIKRDEEWEWDGIVMHEMEVII